MPVSYVTGYAGRTRTLPELLAWSQWRGLDPEFARRILAIMDASIVAGRPLGVGGTIRTIEGQERLFLSRHFVAATGAPACCTYRGLRYQLLPTAAHAAPPGRSYHEPVTAAGKCLAIDWIGDLKFLAEHCAAYGLNEFSRVGREPWHSQPSDIPRGRSGYRVVLHEPLKPWTFPTPPAPQPARILAPRPTLRRGSTGVQVRALQVSLNFWGWRDVLDRTLVVDGGFGARTAQAVMAMQRALGLYVDGIYGPVTAKKLQGFLDLMAAK